MPILNGLLTGLILQLAIGPVFFYVLGITVDGGYANGLCAILAVTIVDYLYIALSLLGVGKILERDRFKKPFTLLSSLVLIAFGVMSAYKGLRFDGPAAALSTEWTPASSFVSCFILTISSPLTIAFWASVFSAKASEKNYGGKSLSLFGVGAGLATFLFLSIAMFAVSSVGKNIPPAVIQVLNGLVGVVLAYYGVSRAVKVIASK